MSDYSNTSIYKIVCKDPNITDLYVGHTTCFKVRENTHKNACNKLVNNVKLYKVIRENGGWNNWDMIELIKINCKNLNEAKIKEQEYYELLNATLNSIPPYKYKIFKPETPKIITKLPTFNTNSIIYNKINSNHEFSCTLCNFSCNKKSNWDIHISTNKHKNNKNQIPKNTNFICKCGQIFKYSSGLSRHKQNCKKIIEEPKNKIEDTKNQTEKLNNQIEEQTFTNNQIIDIIKSDMILFKTQIKTLFERNKELEINNNILTNINLELETKFQELTIKNQELESTKKYLLEQSDNYKSKLIDLLKSLIKNK